MASPGSLELKRYLAKHTTPISIESHAHSVKLIEQGTFRCVKLITLDTARTQTFLLKTVTSDAVPRQIENEVAAIKYVRARTSKIPTPEVLAYSTTAGNEWIAFQNVSGRRLSEVWPEYSEDIKWQVLQSLVDLYKLISAITSLDAFGATQIGGLNLDMTLSETVEAAKSHGRQDVVGYHPGPYRNVEEYLSSYIDKEIHYYATSDGVDMAVFDGDDNADSDVEDGYEGDSTNPSSYNSFSSSLLLERDCDKDSDSEKVDLFDLSSYVCIPTREEEAQRVKNRDDFILYLQSLKTFISSRLDRRELPCLTHNNFHGQNIIVNEDCEIVSLYHWEFAGFYPLSLTFEAPRMDDGDSTKDDIACDTNDEDGRDWTEAFIELFGTVKEVHPLVASILEPMDPTLANAWEE